jgi:hypothetical protein
MGVIIVPIDLSQIEESDRKQQRIKVAFQLSDGVKSLVVPVEAGKAEVRLEVDSKQSVNIAVGPESASDEEIFHLQTLTVRVSPNQWGAATVLTIPPIRITPVWWAQWRWWCRTFVINGRLLCADGSPVPGAEVRAYDVDFFWWWSSLQQVGPVAITDASGHFSIKFTWCCLWWPWWWWEMRQWRLDPLLVDKILPITKLNPAIHFPDPDPQPDFSGIQLNPQPLPPRRRGASSTSAAERGPVLSAGGKVDPSTIASLREQLIAVLPAVPELSRLRIWPWVEWAPWFDCSPNILFRATQNCGGTVKTIVDETVFQTRWDIPTTLTVTLIANQAACCVPPTTPDPEGDCALITGVCGDPGLTVTTIGGNSGAAAAPVGYYDPGGRDRPFAEVVTIGGQFGTASQADYYAIEYTPDGANAWASVPTAALLDFTRGYFDATQPWPNQWFYPTFQVLTFGALHVYMSRQYYEATHPPANWGNALSGRSWFDNVNLLASLQTAGIFSDGAYDFRLVGYTALANGNPDPTTRKVLDGCGDHPQNNGLVLRLDNRVVGPPTPGTVHINTTEPDCGINSVSIGGSAVLPCGSQQLQPGTPLDIDFFVSDVVTAANPIGHLDHYELNVLYGLGLITNLLDPTQVGTLSLTGAAGVYPGPDYLNAVAQGATRPNWPGGAMHLHIDDASKVFPETCCYLIELTVYKRNIVSCDGHLDYYNQMHYSFTVIV